MVYVNVVMVVVVAMILLFTALPQSSIFPSPQRPAPILQGFNERCKHKVIIIFYLTFYFSEQGQSGQLALPLWRDFYSGGTLHVNFVCYVWWLFHLFFSTLLAIQRGAFTSKETHATCLYKFCIRI